MADVNVNAPGDQRKHKFHPRPDSPLHLPNEKPVLGYLKFSAKGTKRKVFGMPILGNLITANIQGEPYYKEYLEKVAKHQRYLAGEQGSDPDSPVPKHTKATKKSKPLVPKADLRPPVTKPASSQQPEPKPAPAKLGLVTKRRKPTSSLSLVNESVAKGIPEKEPRVDDEEADVQRALEESLKSIYDAPWGSLPPMVIREPDSGKYQPLLEKSPADQFIFQRRTSTPTGSSGHDESSSLYAELRLTDSEVKYDEDVLGIDAGVQGEGHAGPKPDEQDKGQARPNPGTFYFLQRLTKDLSFGDLFFNHKPSEADNEKTTTETEVESMVSVIIQQDTSAIPPMTTPIVDLTSRPDSSTTTSTTTKHHRFHSWGTSIHIGESRHTPADHVILYEALKKSMNRDNSEELLKDLVEAPKKKKKRRDSPKTPLGSPPHQPPPPPPLAGPSGTSGSPRASGSSQLLPPPPLPPSTN
nr:histone deacetylase 14 [Tanacetum cinerariifolium]